MFNKHDGGKGDRPTPIHDREKYDNNWDTIFKQKKKKEQYPCEIIRPTTNEDVNDFIKNKLPEIEPVLNYLENK